MKTFRTTGTGSEQTISEIETDKIPLYPTEQDLLDDLANLEVGQIAGTIDPAESELIGVLIQKIQALENGEKYSTEEVKTNKKVLINNVWKDVYRKCYVCSADTIYGNGAWYSVVGWTTEIATDNYKSENIIQIDLGANSYATAMDSNFGNTGNAGKIAGLAGNMTVKKGSVCVIEYIKD